MTTPTPRTDRLFIVKNIGPATRDSVTITDLYNEMVSMESDLAARDAELAEAMRERNDAIKASLDDMGKSQRAEQRAEAAERELAAMKAENSKLRSALEIVHFKREPWQ